MSQRLILHRRKAVAVNLAVDVKGVHVGHAANVVQDGKDAVVDIFCVYVILA